MSFVFLLAPVNPGMPGLPLAVGLGFGLFAFLLVLFAAVGTVLMARQRF